MRDPRKDPRPGDKLKHGTQLIRITRRDLCGSIAGGAWIEFALARTTTKRPRWEARGAPLGWWQGYDFVANAEVLHVSAG